MQYKVLSLTFAMLFAQSSFATTIQDPPKTCPSLPVIKSVGVQEASPTNGIWMGFSVNQYNTNEMWSLATYIFGQFNNENEAIKQANANLALLNNINGPNRDDNIDGWVCAYVDNEANVVAFTFTPPLSHPTMAKYKGALTILDSATYHSH